MLARRILGILKQYPNPEVAYFCLAIGSGDGVYIDGDDPAFPDLEPVRAREDENILSVGRRKAIRRLMVGHFMPPDVRDLLREYNALRKQKGGRLTERERRKYRKARKAFTRYNPFVFTNLSSGYALLHLAYPNKGAHQGLRDALEFLCGPEGKEFQEFVDARLTTIKEEAEFQERFRQAKTDEEYDAIDRELEKLYAKRSLARWLIERRVAKYKGGLVPMLTTHEGRDIFEAGRADLVLPWLAKVINAWLKEHKNTLAYPLDLGWMDHVRHWSRPDKGLPSGVLTVDEQRTARDFVDAMITKMEYEDSFAAQMAAQRAALQRAYDQLILVAKNYTYIADWAIATRPDLLSLTVNQALYRARRWHAALTRQQKLDAERELAAKPGSAVFVTGPYTFYALDTKTQLEDEGQCQGHCVGGYWKDVQEGRTTIYSMRTPDKRIATIEVSNGAERQVQGRFNREIRAAVERKAIAEFFVYMKVRSDSYANEMKEVLAQPKPPETLSGLMGFGRGFGQFSYRY